MVQVPNAYNPSRRSASQVDHLNFISYQLRATPLYIAPAPAMCVHAEEVKKVKWVLAAALKQIENEQRRAQQFKLSLEEAQIKIADLEVENGRLKHKNNIFEKRANTATKNLLDTQDELYRVDKELLSLMEDAREAREEAKQSRSDVSVALGEVARLNGMGSGLMRELEQEKRGATEQEMKSVQDELAVAQAEVERISGVVDHLSKRMRTYDKLLDDADRELVAAQDEAEDLRKRNAELRKKGHTDVRWQLIYRSKEVCGPA